MMVAEDAMRGAATLDELSALSSREFVDVAYSTILDRSPTEDERARMLSDLDEGQARTWLLGRLRFGAEDTPIQLRAGFAELREAVASVAGARDVDTLTEVLWAALHGLTTLSRNERLRPGRDTDRIELLVAQLRAIGS